MSQSAIEWTDATWNPVTGCDRVSPGCANCYALDLAARLKRMGQPRYQRDGGKSSGPGFGVTLHPDKLEEPLRWRKPRMVFVNSMSDLFHEEIPDEYIAKVFDVMRLADRHTFQVLTKRPERMAELVPQLYDYLSYDILEHGDPLGYLPNVWLGVSIENGRFVQRADLLRETPAAVRFISAEPLLGPLIERVTHGRHCFCSACANQDWSEPQLAPCGMHGPACPPRYAPYRSLDLTRIDWLIAGGESGANHRPIRAKWVADLRDACLAQCRDCDALGCHGLQREKWTPGFQDDRTHWAACRRHTAFFFKQWGGRTPKSGGRELDGRTWDELPLPVARELVAA